MAVRTAYVSTQSPGDVLTSANFTKLPGGWIGYAEVTADQTTITSETDLTSLTVTVTVGSNRRIKITGHIRVNGSTTDNVAGLRIKESTTTLQLASTYNPGTSSHTTLIGQVVLTPSAGSHSYKLSLETLTGGGNVSLEASATNPAYILVEDMGPAS